MAKRSCVKFARQPRNYTQVTHRVGVAVNLSAEWSLYAKLKSLDNSVAVFNGLTDYEQRRASMKSYIERIGPEVIYRTIEGKNVTLAQQWSRTYNQDWV